MIIIVLLPPQQSHIELLIRSVCEKIFNSIATLAAPSHAFMRDAIVNHHNIYTPSRSIIINSICRYFSTDNVQ